MRGTPTTADAGPTEGGARSLVSLLGDQRATIVEHLRRNGDATVSELAARLEVSEVAVRRHLAVLVDEDLVTSEVVAGARGRPAARYRLTATAGRLFPHRYDRFATEVLDFLDAHHGRAGLLAFLRWRVDREAEGLSEAVTAEDLHARLQQLADALSEAGFDASVAEDGESFTLVQDHCAIYDVAKDHPEVCSYEAATFSKVLGSDVQLSRRATLAGGASACVCTVRPCGSAGPSRDPDPTPAAAGEDGTATVPNPSGPHRDHDPDRRPT